MNEKKLKVFLDAAHSLKLYRRAELTEEKTGQTQIDQLYVDPLPNSHIFNVMTKPNTAFLIGRKGTGKSTIFQRVQHEIRKRDNSTSVYLDIKTIYESANIDEGLLEAAAKMDYSLPTDQIRKLFLFRSFLISVVAELKSELQKRIESSFWERLKEKFKGSLTEVFEGLDSVIEDLERSNFESVLGVKSIQVGSKHGVVSSINSEIDLKAGLAANPTFSAGIKESNKNEQAMKLLINILTC